MPLTKHAASCGSVSAHHVARYFPPPVFASNRPINIQHVFWAAALPVCAMPCSSTQHVLSTVTLCCFLALCRDLAEQTHKCFEAYGKFLTAPSLSSVLLVGGLDAGPKLKALKAGAEIVVGTPGRMMDFVETGKLPLNKVWGSAGCWGPCCEPHTCRTCLTLGCPLLAATGCHGVTCAGLSKEWARCGSGWTRGRHSSCTPGSACAVSLVTASVGKSQSIAHYTSFVCCPRRPC